MLTAISISHKCQTPGLPQNEVSNKLWEIYDHTAFDKWYCGHHHIDTQYGRVRLLYDDPVFDS